MLAVGKTFRVVSHKLIAGVIPMAGILRSLTVLPKSEIGEKPTCIRTMSIKNKSSACFEELEDGLRN